MPADSLDVLPSNVASSTAATPPAVGLIAYRALKQGGLMLGKFVRVTGAAVVLAQLRR